MPSSDMDIDRPLSREEVLTPNTDDFIIGDRVWVNGTKPGYIQYLGEVQFSPGDWAGVVLDEHSGKNDGSVAGVRYFQCEAKRGVFARLHKLTRYPLVHATTPTKMGSNTPTPPPPIQRCLTPTRTPSPGARALREGDRVQVSSSSGGPPKTGVLRYMGHTDFATGEWAGVELDDPLGKNDGTVAGKRYFRCAQNYGLFSPAHKVSRCTSSLGRQGRTRNTVPEREEPPKNIPIQNEKDASYRFSEESERRAQRLRQLLETAEAERRDLVSKLEEERRKVEELEFRIEEECIGKDDLEVERERERHRIEELERRLEQEVRKNEMRDGGATPDTILKEETQALSKEVEHLREKLRQADQQMKDLQHAKQASLPKPSSLPVADELVRKEEALLQAQLTLDNKKREVQNLLDRIAETEKELEKCKARQSRQIDTIDELNMKLQKSESKCSSVQEELHTTRQMIGEMDRRLKTCGERVSHLEKDKLRLEEQLLNPESTPEAQALRERLQERERDCSEWRKEAEVAREEVDRQREERDRIKKELEEKLQNLKEEHQDEWRKERKKYTESAETSFSKIRELERKLTSVRSDLEQNRVEAEARLSRQEARLQEAELKGQNLDRIRDQMSRLQSEKDLLRVEKEEILKRLQVSEEARTRWEGEANRSTAEVEVLKVQVLQLKTEFTTHREDLVKKLAETKFDAQMVQDLHEEIEEQRRLVETMQQRLKSSEEEKEQLKDDLSITQEGREKMESHLRRDLEALKRRLSDSESERASLQRSLEAAQLLAEERAVQQQQSKVAEKNELDKLEKNLVSLQAELASLKNGQTKPDSDQAKLMQDKEALEQQVHFMNSVIVDMQHKNDDLRSRLDILETEVLFDGHTRMSLGSRSPSRAFCDICDTFDIHDTEDCPKQLSVRRTLSYSSQESEF